MWEILNGLCDHLGLDRLGDEAFRALVLARVIEPTSKADTVRVLTEIGVASPHRVTFMRCLKRVVERDYRAAIAQDWHRDWDLVERARELAGIKGYVTTIEASIMDGHAVAAAYHDHYQVERYFRIAKSDLAARRVFHRIEDSIQAHLTVMLPPWPSPAKHAPG